MLNRIPVFVILRTYDNYIPANMMLQRLEEQHIRAYLQNELTDPIFANAVGGIKLMVHEGQLGRAIELVDGFENLQRNSITCSQCGSGKVQLVISNTSPVNWIAAFFARLRGRSLRTTKDVYRCFNCNHEVDEHSLNQDGIYHPFKAEFREDQQN